MLFVCTGFKVAPSATESLTMIAVPGGSFQIGSLVGIGLADERPIHRVNLTEFRMSKFEVTQTEYEEIMSTNPSYFWGETDSPERPVEYVTWFDAVEFCNKLSLNDGYQPVYTITGRTPAAAAITMISMSAAMQAGTAAIPACGANTLESA